MAEVGLWDGSPDVALLDQDTGVVDGLGETELVDAGLQATLQEILDLEGQDVIKLHAGLVEHTDTDETANEGIAFEQSLGAVCDWVSLVFSLCVPSRVVLTPSHRG